ncbi:CheR family methyltransferase [Oxobacter pfennigii]|nr:protein-glutamate O-methyltransferase CheR [Oxobacter pfennigii]
MDLKSLESWIFKELHIDLSAYKSNQMNRRLTNFITRSGTTSVNEYIKLMDKNPELKQKLKDFITINVSEFFRNKELFAEFEKKVREVFLKDNKKLKIWSAACSNGAEPYSVAMILDRLTPNVRHTIIATDIDATILETAKKGEYNPNDIKNVDSNALSKYFTKIGDKYAISPDIKSRVQFKKHDLIRDPYEKGFDIILCRNVVIYFTAEIKDKLYRQFSESLNPGGILFVGATESIYNYSQFGFDKASTFIYQKKG